jgi:acetyl esterase
MNAIIPVMALAFAGAMGLVAARIMIHRWVKTPYGELAPGGAVLLKIMSALKIELFRDGEPFTECRRRRNASTRFLSSRGVRLAEVKDIEIQGRSGVIPARRYTPVCGEYLPVVVYFHGGGWCMGNLDTHDHICRLLAKSSHAVVFSIDCRLVPEHPFPAAVEDAQDAVLWIHAHAAGMHCDKNRMAVAGDSSGANLAAVAAVLARDSGGPMISCQILMYPVTDLSRMDTGSYRSFGEGYYLSRKYMEKFRSLYIPDPERWSDPLASPLLTNDLNGLPPAVLITAWFDVLRDEGEEYAERLKNAGVPVVHKRFGKVFHGFIGMDRIFPQAREAITMIASVLQEKFNLDGVEKH